MTHPIITHVVIYYEQPTKIPFIIKITPGMVKNNEQSVKKDMGKKGKRKSLKGSKQYMTTK
jgi:hypothetical protein